MSNSAGRRTSASAPEAAAGTASGAMGWICKMGVGALLSQFGAYLGSTFWYPVALNIAIFV